jgi:hypothetical protein
MCDFAAALADRVIPRVPMRQWVLTVPHGLRGKMAYDPGLTTVVLRQLIAAVTGWLRGRARRLGIRGPIKTGAVTVIQRFNSALDVSPHFHVLFMDGLYSFPVGRKPVFHPTPAPRDEDVAHVAAAVFRRVERKLADREEAMKDGRPGVPAPGPQAGRSLTASGRPARLHLVVDGRSSLCSAGALLLMAMLTGGACGESRLAGGIDGRPGDAADVGTSDQASGDAQVATPPSCGGSVDATGQSPDGPFVGSVVYVSFTDTCQAIFVSVYDVSQPLWSSFDMALPTGAEAGMDLNLNGTTVDVVFGGAALQTSAVVDVTASDPFAAPDAGGSWGSVQGTFSLSLDGFSITGSFSSPYCHYGRTGCMGG